MVTFTLPTSRRVTQDWNQDFQWLNGKYYPNGFYASIGWKGHNGIDYGCPEGDPVESVCDGVVEYIGPGNNHPLLSGGGNVVLVRNDEMQMRFEYLHLSQQNVYTGQKVKRGQVIALSGNTGTSTAPHLHVGAIPVKPNVNNGYRGRVDLTGWLYGPSNPDYAGLAAQGTITSEDDEMALTDETKQWLKDNLLNKADGGQLRADLGYQNETLLTKADGAYMNNVRDAQFAAVMESLGKTLNKDDGGYIVQLVQAIQPGTTDVKAVADALAGIIPAGIAKEVADELSARLGK